MRKTIGFLALAAGLSIIPSSLLALPIDLGEQAFYVRKGFDQRWSLVEHDRGSEWKHLPATSDRSLKVPDVGLPGLPERGPFDLSDYPPQSFTFTTDFFLSEGDLEIGQTPSLYLAIAGVNWEIYLNGELLRREMYVARDGRILIERNIRHILVPLDPRALRVGQNRLAFHVYGDPTDLNTGFFRREPYLIDRHKKLAPRYNDIPNLILSALFLFVGVFHVLLYFRRGSATYNLWFGMFCIFLFLFGFMRLRYVNDLITDSWYIHRIELTALFLLFPIFSAFLSKLLSNSFGRFTAICLAYTLVFIAAILTTPMPVVENILNAWAILSLAVPIPLYAGRIVVHATRDFRTRRKEDSILRSISGTLVGSVSGNLLIGTLVLAGCAIFDLLNTLLWHYSITLANYGFVVFVGGTAFLLANHMLTMRERVQRLNEDLEKKIEDLNQANQSIRASEEVYRLLVEGTTDIIFHLDHQFRLLNVNRSIRKHLGHSPDKLKGTDFLDLLHPGDRERDQTNWIVRERMARFIEARAEPFDMKLNMRTAFNEEPKEFHIRLEHVQTEGRDEILGKASSVIEDSLLKFFISEKQRYVIGNLIVTTEEITQRLVRNLTRYMDHDEVIGLRVALREIIINAVEHGNLAVTFEEKTAALMEDRYQAFLRERQRDPEYADRQVTIDYLLEPERVVYKISDEGAGFDVEKVMKKKAEELNEEMEQHGRGIKMTREAFDEVQYNSKGNVVVLTRHLKGRPSY